MRTYVRNAIETASPVPSLDKYIKDLFFFLFCGLNAKTTISDVTLLYVCMMIHIVEWLKNVSEEKKQEKISSSEILTGKMKHTPHNLIYDRSGLIQTRTRRLVLVARRRVVDSLPAGNEPLQLP